LRRNSINYNFKELNINKNDHYKKAMKSFDIKLNLTNPNEKIKKEDINT
jgi:hypothetical protein